MQRVFHFANLQKSMSYIPIKALSVKFAIPLRTVYHHLANNKSIRSKKEWRTKLVHVADFARMCKIELQDWQEDVNKNEESKPKSNANELQKNLQSLQHEYDATKEQNFNLQRFNSNLQEQVGKYAILLSEEKNEKKDLMQKYDNLQNKHQSKVETLTKRFYFLLWLAVILLAILILQFAPNLQKRFVKG